MTTRGGRRARKRQRPRGASGERRADRRVLVVALAVVVGSGLFGLALDRGFDEGDSAPELERTGSAVVQEEPAEEWTFAEPPTTYRIVYDVATRAGNDVARATQELLVSRPYRSRFEARAGEPPGRRVTARRVSGLGTMALINSNGETGVFAPPPGLAGSDLRGDIALPDAADRAIVDVLEQRRVHGRRCQVYRTGGPVNAGELKPYRGGAEYADTCVDERGLVLEEIWFRDGDWVRRRVAREVELAIVPAAGAFDPPAETVSGGGERGFVRPVDPSTLPEGPAWVLAEPPEGFTHRGRYVFSPPDLRAFAEPGERGRAQSIGVTDVYEDGADVVFVEQTISTSAAASFPDAPNSEEVDLGDLGTGEAVIDMRGNEVRVAFPNSRAVRVVGTLPLQEVVAIARRLVAVDGTGVEILGD